MLFIVYVGAVAILFVFCVMLLSLQSEGFVGSLQYISYTTVLVLFSASLFIFFSPYYVFSADYFSFSFFDFALTFYTKDVIFLTSFYSLYTSYITFLGILLFFVTVAVTVLIGLKNSLQIFIT